jgi:hypothetical protein
MEDYEPEDTAIKTFYVSVQAGQILEDPEAAAYELVVRMNERDHAKLSELLDELSSMDEAQMFHFSSSPFGSASDEEINAGYDGLIKQIYTKLYEHGTAETKRQIETMQVM